LAFSYVCVKKMQYTFRGWVIWLHVSSFPHLRHYRWHSLSAKHKPHLVVSDVPELKRAPYNLWISMNVTVTPFQVNIGQSNPVSLSNWSWFSN